MLERRLHARARAQVHARAHSRTHALQINTWQDYPYKSGGGKSPGVCHAGKYCTKYTCAATYTPVMERARAGL